MDVILFEVFLRSIDLIPQHRYYIVYSIDNIIVLSDLVESSDVLQENFREDRVHVRLLTRLYGRRSDLF